LTIKKVAHVWSKDAFLNKAQRYANLMVEQDKNDWQFGFWSSLTLEMLIKATFANISPTLVADGKDWENTYFSISGNSTESKSNPKTIDISFLVRKLPNIVPDFTKELLNSIVIHVERRNGEMHSGDLPFDDLGTDVWLPKYYATSKVLLKSLGEELSFLFGAEEASFAEELIVADNDLAAQAVKQLINATQIVWGQLSELEKEQRLEQAKIYATRESGHRVICPVCKATALVKGEAKGSATENLKNELIEVKQTMLPSMFECKACHLKISGHSKLNACNLGAAYTSTLTFDPYEYYQSEPEEERWKGFDEDNNEP
jgi:hypothetical protein